MATTRPISKMSLAKDVDGQISPTQTHSTINSATSSASYTSSSPGPSTPPSRPNRSRSRYPDLGRVPLHRRGTSKTYERLEDLLKEAGYKETRVFTPETDRTDAAQDKAPGGMGAVVDFFSHLFPAGISDPDSAEGTYSRPPTPSYKSPSSDSYDEPTPRPTAKDRLQQTYQRYAPAAQSSQVMHQPKAMQSPTSPLAHPRPSRAGAYLRHMASAASMPHPARPSSTPANSRIARRKRDDDDDDPSIIFSRKGNGEGEEDHHGQPPLPPTWLETVARAVLFGGGASHIGGPSSTQKPPPQVLRPSRSSLSQATKQNSSRRSGLSDQTNLLIAPPPLLTMIERGRSGRSESQVTRTKVVCRSAPGSRATSPVRRGGEKSRGRGEHRRKKQGGDGGRVPSLARTQTEDDAWNNGKGRPSTANDVKHRYLLNEIESGTGAASSEEEEDDHEGELDLARMLLHPKRQNSIRSLRRHLNGGAEGSGAVGVLRYTRPPVSPLRDDEDWPYEQEQWGSGWTKRPGGIADADEEEEAETFARFIGAQDSRGRSNRSQSRQALPGWGQGN